MANNQFTVEIEQLEDFRFAVRFPEGGLITDEPAPLGAGQGPNAAELLAAAVCNCLTASLLFCLRKSHVASEHLTARAHGRVERDANGHLRIAAIDVTLVAPEATARCLDLFQNYCTVTESVRAGIAVRVAVTDKEGRILHQSPGHA
ncbi:MAG TPA: OsmC family protein [Acidiferrobacter sp.]|nr:OsmC family protein [Acidiferrobacter sp.]